MELLLNLAWLLLVVPGYWLWHHRLYSRHASSRQCLLALGCAFVLLFPVISASDDLHAMRAEMEDPSSGKRVARPVCEKQAAGVNRLQGAPGFVVSTFVFRVPQGSELQLPAPVFSRSTHLPVQRPGRAPPVSLLG
jgi:hypothetical protein